jgi:2-dehydro-3-deoxy-D-arabinonate dehydratase
VSVLLAGTSLVPEEGFTLRAGDPMDISIKEIGMLSSDLTEV